MWGTWPHWSSREKESSTVVRNSLSVCTFGASAGNRSGWNQYLPFAVGERRLAIVGLEKRAEKDLGN